MRSPILALILLTSASTIAAHDIPNARVDRSTQATIEPGRLRVDYEVSLAELTLCQDLKQLVGELPGADRRAWFEEYGKVVGPLNAKGFLVEVDGEEVALQSVGFVLSIEGHPRYTFHFEAPIPSHGQFSINDTNYQGSEGTTRLALRPSGQVRVEGDSLPTDVNSIPARPTWQLTPEEERRTRRVRVSYSPSETTTSLPVASPPKPVEASSPSIGLSRLFDEPGGRAWPPLMLAALVLGAAHAIQPGHGKSIIAASTLGPGLGPLQGALLGLATATAHMASVGLIAAILWSTRGLRPESIHSTLAHVAGFVIAAIGCWRLGRHLAGFVQEESEATQGPIRLRALLPLAMAGGVVPCWEAVVLVVVAEGIGQLPLGLALLGSFSLGMAAVLVLVGVSASRLRAAFDRSERREVWSRRFGILGGLLLATLGIMLMGTP